MSTTTALTEVKLSTTNEIPSDFHSTSHQYAINDGPPPGHHAEAVDAITPEMRRREKVVFISMCAALFMAGWNDGTIGPLLPRIQHFYGVGFTVVSLIFITGCLGSISGFLGNVFLTDRFKFGTLMIGASLCQLVTYAIQAAAPPFPVFCIFFFLNGFGLSIQDAQANGLVASIHEHAEEKMGVLHAVYGLGAFCAPLVSTQFAQQPRWSFHFLVSLGFALINTIGLVLTVRARSMEAVLKSIGSPMMDTHPTHPPTSGEMELQTPGSHASGQPSMSTIEQNTGSGIDTPESSSEKSSIRRILGNSTVQLMATFILVYVGVEVTIGGWVVTYIINVRGGGPSSGYISSGFFGGLTLGRVALLWVNKAVGERQVIFIYAALAIGLELVIWLVPSLIGDAIAISIVGVLLGPMYPLSMNHVGRVLPRKILTGSIGWIAGFGQAGAAVVPFMTGALASRFGIKSLQPLLVAMMALMTVVWALIPGHSKRKD